MQITGDYNVVDRVVNQNIEIHATKDICIKNSTTDETVLTLYSGSGVLLDKKRRIVLELLPDVNYIVNGNEKYHIANRDKKDSLVVNVNTKNIWYGWESEGSMSSC